MRQGMVLLEVVTALGIFIIVAMSLIMALDAGMDAAKERNEIDTAMRGITNQLALLHATRINLTDKDLPDDGSGISYHLTIEITHLQDQKKQPLAGTYRVTITAKWVSEGEPEDRSISELIYQP
jgi:hypothetical protein